MTLTDDYVRNATVVRVIDGDSVKLDADLGYQIWRRGPYRILGINAREHNAPGGPEATANLAALLPVGTKVTIQSVKVDKYGGRYDAAVTLPDGRDLATLLVADGWAAAWDGTGERPLPPWPREITPVG